MRILRSLWSRIARASEAYDTTRFVFVFVGVVYVVRVVASGWRTGFPLFFPDSSSYIDVSRIGVLDPSFWFSDRPVGVPLVLWMVGGNHRAFFLAQTLLFAVALAHLCAVLMRVIPQRWLAWIIVAITTSICVHPRFALWHLEVLSESLALSLSILIVATWLKFAHEPSRRNLLGGVVMTVAWMSVRDVHIVTGIVIALALIIRALPGRTWSLRKPALVGAAVLAAFSSYVLIAQNASGRNLYPLINNVGERVLPNAEVTKTFVDRGMPIDDALRNRTGADSWSDEQAFLLSPELEDFRSWADSHGQRALLTSLVADASFWTGITRSAFEATLSLDFEAYDRHGTSDRLPTRLFWIQAPRTSTQLLALSALGLVALGILFATPSRRRLAAIGSVALISTLADSYVSASGDSVEVQRHVLGPIFRLTLVLVVIVAIGAAELVQRLARRRQRDPAPRDHQRTRISLSASLALSLGVVGIFGAWVALEHRSQDFDPQYARTIIERAARFGGSYYENGVHNKGPFETVVYDSVRSFTRFETYWFGISAYVVIASIVLGVTAWTIARALRSSSSRVSSVPAATAGALVTTHFAISDSDYAGVLYSRNITMVIFAAIVATTIWESPWRKPRRALISYFALFALIGLAVQTLLTAIFAAIVVGTFVYVRRSPFTGLHHPFAAAAVTSASTVASAPLWYALRGSFGEFWSGWWTYAGYMSSSTGRSLLNQFGLGAQKLFGYYQERPGIALVIIAFVFLLRSSWDRLSTSARTLHVMLLAWFCAGWVELVLSQRYSSHYFSIVAVPTAFIAVAIAVLVVDRISIETSGRRTKRNTWWPAIAAVVALIASQGTHLAWIAVEGAGRFRSTSHYVQAREAMRTGAQETRQAVFDLVTDADDPLLAWTMYPWTYLDYRRVPATRFSWKAFLIGEIYLARTSSKYVLDRTWEWFAQDLDESRPRIYARPQVTALEPATPFKDVVEEDFVTVYSDEEMEIGWKEDLWSAVTSPSAESRREIETNQLPANWRFDSAVGRITAGIGADPWMLGLESCRVFTTRIVRTSTADPMGITFQFAPIDPELETSSLSVDFDRAWSMRDDDFGVESPIELQATVLEETEKTFLDVSLVVTPTAVATIVDGRIVSAILLPGPSTIAVIPSVDDLTMTVPTRSKISGFTGC